MSHPWTFWTITWPVIFATSFVSKPNWKVRGELQDNNKKRLKLISIIHCHWFESKRYFEEVGIAFKLNYACCIQANIPLPLFFKICRIVEYSGFHISAKWSYVSSLFQNWAKRDNSPFPWEQALNEAPSPISHRGLVFTSGQYKFALSRSVLWVPSTR